MGWLSFTNLSIPVSSIFQATAGRGIMFWNARWSEVDVRDESSQKLLFAAVAAVGSFNSSTPYFWMNLLTVFSCSISLVGSQMWLHPRGYSEQSIGHSAYHFFYHFRFAGTERVSTLLRKWNYWSCLRKRRFCIEVVELGNTGDSVILAWSGRSFVSGTSRLPFSIDDSSHL